MTMPPPSPLAIVRQALAFFRRPHSLQPGEERFPDQVRPLLALWAFNLTGLFLLLPLLLAWTRAMGIEPPQMTQKIPGKWLILLTVFILPVVEEIVFRGWMTGKRWQLLSLGLFPGAVLLAAFMFGLTRHAAAPLQIGLTALPLLAVAVVLLLLRRRSDRADWFARQFKWWFWGSALVFGSAHYCNYHTTGWAVLPVVLPQLWSGLIFGFTRLRFGLLRSIALHCASNAFVLAAFYLFRIPAA
jgi:membrane protease YdiL (CAAX protease family)